ncbi:ribonucleoside-diphosphate reductase large subunit-like [Scylla paramamosain]|uniref:ribonucleoside-diphosphate reductase large subunit-like n=1 Tax=Scylla paramamosain TaxID=85552 RepID=UPI0030831FBC
MGILLATTRGSIQDIKGIDADTKLMFKTVWEIRQMSLVEMAIARAPFIDQSQSLNIYIDASIHPNVYAKVNALHRTAWSKGLKTGLYYLRIRPKYITYYYYVTQLHHNIRGQSQPAL